VIASTVVYEQPGEARPPPERSSESDANGRIGDVRRRRACPVFIAGNAEHFRRKR
jgi:hypothetical protein